MYIPCIYAIQWGYLIYTVLNEVIEETPYLSGYLYRQVVSNEFILRLNIIVYNYIRVYIYSLTSLLLYIYIVS